MQILGKPRSYPTKCQECGAGIFFHTNGFGDAVFFDDLGPPWPIHWCFESRVRGRIVTDPAAYRARMLAVYGTPTRPRQPSRKASWTTGPRRRMTKPRPVTNAPIERPINIARCEPSNFLGRMLDVSGVVHDVHEGRSISAQFAEAGSLGFGIYNRAIGSTIFTQLTVVDADFMSYTVLVAQPKLAVRRGSIVSMRIEAVETLRDPLFVCRALEELQLEIRD
jgi:hypothetical protein